MRYALITPARNEVENLKRLADSVRSQSISPQRWVIVDTGSTDGTWAVAEGLGRTHEWIVPLALGSAEAIAPGAPVVRAFHSGLENLGDADAAVIVKLDADVSMGETYFEQLLNEFESRPGLGIAGGVCYEMDAGRWKPTHSTGGHVRGAVRAYRRNCLEAVLPLEEGMGWDGIDELKASILGWETETLPGLRFYHHRRVGARDGGRAVRWKRQGEGSYYMGYRPSYLVFRAVHHARRDPAALAMIPAYFGARLNRRPRCADRSVIDYLRRQQRWRQLPRRFSEARGGAHGPRGSTGSAAQ